MGSIALYWTGCEQSLSIHTTQTDLAQDVRFECGDSGDLRRRFAKTSTLQNKVEKDYRSVMDNEPVFAFHKSFKFGPKSSETTRSVLYSLAYIQDEVAQYASARGLTYMRPLWKSYFSSEDALITFHYLDFANAVEMAGNYSNQLAHDARKAEGQEYADIVALSARQVLGATIFSGTPDSPLIFLKEISSDGNTQTVDVIFPAWPFFVYTNPRWLAWLLEPLLEHQLSGQYPNKYSMHDLGSHFPNLTGHADGNDEYMPVEECGDMLIMGLSLVQSLTYDLADTASSMWASLGQQHSMGKIDEKLSPFALLADADQGSATFGLDNKWGGGAEGVKQARLWLDRSFPIWKQWTEYLIDESLIPGNQRESDAKQYHYLPPDKQAVCTDDFAGWLPLQTNLALKGIIGIKAMSELSRVMGLESEVKYYQVHRPLALPSRNPPADLLSSTRTSPTRTFANGRATASRATARTPSSRTTGTARGRRCTASSPTPFYASTRTTPPPPRPPPSPPTPTPTPLPNPPPPLPSTH